MKRFWSLVPLAAGLALAVPAGAQRSGKTSYPEGTWVVVVGRVTSEPKRTTDEEKMQVGIGPEKTDYTLHLSTAVAKGKKGRLVDEDRFNEGTWVRAEGRVMDDPRRIKVNRIRMIGLKGRPSLRGLPYYRRGFSQGYVVRMPGR